MKPILVIYLATSLFVSSAISADTKEGEEPSTKVKQANVEESTFDLDFPGGSPAELVKAIEKADGKTPNVIIQPGAEKIVFPKLQLKSVTINRIFDTLNRTKDGNERSIYCTWTAQNKIWVLQTLEADNKIIGKVFSVELYLQKYKIEDIITAIQSAWGMAGTDQGTGLKFHQETQLLMVIVSNPEQLRVVENVLQELSKGSQPMYRLPPKVVVEKKEEQKKE